MNGLPLTTGRIQGRQGADQIRQFRLQLAGAVLTLTRHHFSEQLTALAAARRVGREHPLPALPPGATRAKQIRQCRAQRSGLVLGDAEVEGWGRSAHPHEHLQQLAGTEDPFLIVPNRQGRGGQRLDQVGMAGQLTFGQLLRQTPIGGLLGQPAVDGAQGEEHLGAGGGELAVTQHRQLGVVHAAEVEGIGEGGEHAMGPAVAGMPDADEMGEGDTARGKRFPVTQAIGSVLSERGDQDQL